MYILRICCYFILSVSFNRQFLTLMIFNFIFVFYLPLNKSSRMCAILFLKFYILANNQVRFLGFKIFLIFVLHYIIVLYHNITVHLLIVTILLKIIDLDALYDLIIDFVSSIQMARVQLLFDPHLFLFY